MGTTRSPWRYDAEACGTLQPAILRRPAISRFAFSACRITPVTERAGRRSRVRVVSFLLRESHAAHEIQKSRIGAQSVPTRVEAQPDEPV